MATAAQKRERDRVLAQVADRLLEAGKADQAERDAEAARVAAAVEHDKQVFEAYVEARALYQAKQDAMIDLLPKVADMIVDVDLARQAQDRALALAQKSSAVDLPMKILDLDAQVVRENYTGAFGAPDKEVPDRGRRATEAMAALRQIRRARP